MEKKIDRKWLSPQGDKVDYSQLSPGVAVKIPKYVYLAAKAESERRKKAGSWPRGVTRVIFEMLDPAAAAKHHYGMT